MYVCDKIHVLLSTLCYMFRPLLHHLHAELHHMLKTIVIIVLMMVKRLYCMYEFVGI